MVTIPGYDAGATLYVQCDRCPEPIMAFGKGAEGRPELEAMLRAEGWRQLGGDGWLCPRCAAVVPSAEESGA
jgi:hypothetical protein